MNKIALKKLFLLSLLIFFISCKKHEDPGNLLHLAVVDWIVATGFETRGYQDKANDVWQKYYTKLRDYKVERNREKEDDEIIMKSDYNL